MLSLEGPQRKQIAEMEQKVEVKHYIPAHKLSDVLSSVGSCSPRWISLMLIVHDIRIILYS